MLTKERESNKNGDMCANRVVPGVVEGKGWGMIVYRADEEQHMRSILEHYHVDEDRKETRKKPLQGVNFDSIPHHTFQQGD